MRELYLTLITMQDQGILSADKAGSLGLVELEQRLNRLVQWIGLAINEIATEGVLKVDG